MLLLEALTRCPTSSLAVYLSILGIANIEEIYKLSFDSQRLRSLDVGSLPPSMRSSYRLT